MNATVCGKYLDKKVIHIQDWIVLSEDNYER